MRDISGKPENISTRTLTTTSKPPPIMYTGWANAGLTREISVRQPKEAVMLMPEQWSISVAPGLKNTETKFS